MDKEHLTLQDIVCGDFVQEWLEIPGKWGTPMFVDGVFGDGSLYLNLDGNEADPFDANVKDVYDIPIDFGILTHFGFFESDHHVWQKECGGWLLQVSVHKPYKTFLTNAMLTYMKDDCNKGKTLICDGTLNSIRALQHWFYDETKQPLKLNFE